MSQEILTQLEEITRQTLEKRWNGNFFTIGPQLNLNNFWIRDTGIIAKSLIEFGEKERLLKSLEWALEKSEKKGTITTTISTQGYCYDVYSQGIDTLYSYLFCISLMNQRDLFSKHFPMFQADLDLLTSRFEITEENIFSDFKFSSPKDLIDIKDTAAIYIYLFALKSLIETEYPELKTTLPNSEILRTLILKHFFHSGYILNDRKSLIDKSADPNIFALKFKLVNDESQQKSIIDWLENNGFCDPFPIKLHLCDYPEYGEFLTNIILPNYQGNSIWMLYAYDYIQQLAHHYPEKARQYIEKIVNKIITDRQLCEVYTPDGQKRLPGRFGYKAGSEIVWVVNYYCLYKNLVN